jgi:cytochrome c553
VKRTLLLLFIPFAVFTWIFFGISQKSCTDVMQADAAKGIPFDHKTHVEKYDIKDCATCHKYDENGRFLGIPTIGECTACHARDAAMTANDPMTPRKKSMFDSYKDTDKPWTSWAKQPDLVYFSHKVVMTAKFEDGRLKANCVTCHGDKSKSTDTSMIKGKILMGECERCHDALQISNKCAVCHD